MASYDMSRVLAEERVDSLSAQDLSEQSWDSA